jgi:predicted nucleic acid-binding protein
MTVVSDTSPLCYLAWIEQLDLLPALFGEIIIPPAVLEELKAEGAPAFVRQRFQNPLDWLKVQAVESPQDESLLRLHPGEREAILLAELLRADLVLLDDRDARRIASARGLRLTGLLGVLGEAASRQWIDLPGTIQKLQNTSFRASPSLLKSFLDRYTI